ncbi:MAG: Lrp/AsnC ligand binding domain-containing protein [Halofilum sp. (in: g-proteobacteria)]|nr:Lrp/AsnC ligand binding domain-containing protein [Halofilum sp. (in: g-proteobacteria)]
MPKRAQRKASDHQLDRTDKRILRELQANGRISNVELARRVNLSATPCLERVRRLEQAGYIRDYVAVLDPQRLEVGLLLYVEVTLDRTTPEVFERFKETIAARPEVQECHMVAGGFDYLVKVRVPDMESYRAFLGDGLTAAPGVRETHTYVVMEEIKETTGIEIRD